MIEYLKMHQRDPDMNVARLAQRARHHRALPLLHRVPFVHHPRLAAHPMCAGATSRPPEHREGTVAPPTVSSAPVAVGSPRCRATTDHFHCPQTDTSTASANDSGMTSPNLRDQHDRTNANPEPTRESE
jgi:hypothetical protein